MGLLSNQMRAGAAGAAGGGSGFYTHQIANSCRFIGSANDDGTNYMYHTQGTPTNADKCTISAWVKRSKLGSRNLMFTGAGSGSYYSWYGFNPSNEFWHLQSGDQPRLESNAVYRDTGGWMHIVIANDSTQGTASNRNKVYINGVQYTDWGDYEDYSTQNSDIAVNTNGTRLFVGSGGASASNSFYPFNGYIAEYVFIDGTQYAASDFGETKNGAWIPKDPSGLTFGNNGSYLKFESSGDLGNDSSGNNNDFTVTGVAAHDQMLDTPTFGSEGSANFPAFSPLYYTQSTNITDGNLDFRSTGNIEGGLTNAVIPAGESTVYYFEAAVTPASGGHEVYWGVNGLNIDMSGSSERGGRDEATCWAILLQPSGYQYVQAGSFDGRSEVSLTISTGDIIGMVIDRANTTIKWYINNSLKVTSTNLIATGDLAVWSGKGGGTTDCGIILNAGQDGTFCGTKTAQGNSDSNGFGNYYYTPPTGTVGYCTGNLSAAGADPALEKQPVNNYFQAVAYTGTGANGRSLTTKLKPVNFIGKNRTTGTSTPTRWFATTGNNFGTGTELYVQLDTDSYGYSSSTYQGVSNPQDNSITIGNVGYINVGSSSYVAYLHGVAGAAAVTDTSGDIDSLRFTDADAGISIMDYTGSGTNGNTVPHGLGVKPSLVIIKNSTITGNSAAWRVWSDAFGDYNDYAVLNTSAVWQTSGGIFTADPTTTMLPLASGDTQNSSSNTYIAWVFANTAGMVKAGTYVGNGNVDGSFIYTGFKPAWVMVKNTTASEHWVVADNATNPTNVVSSILKTNNNNPEATGSTYYCDFLSNGFKPRTTWEGWNQTNTFVYLAFAEMPFKYATAR